MTGTDLTSKLSAQLSFPERKVFRSLFSLSWGFIIQNIKDDVYDCGKTT